MSAPIFHTVQDLLDSAAVPYTVLKHPPVVTVAQARTLVPELLPRLATTVAFSVKDAGYVLVTTRAGDRVGYPALARAIAVNRRRLRLAGPQAVELALGFEIGGVGPFPVSGVDQVIVDTRVAAWDRLACGAGVRTRSIDIAVADLLKVSSAAIAEVAIPAEDC